MLHTESSQLDLTSRYDFVLLFDVVDGNPNGDPDAGNMPRLDPETMQGLVTDGAIKRKVRDFITLRHQDPDGTPKEGMDIFVKHGGVLNTEIESAYRKIGIAPRPKGEAKTTTTQRTTARDMMCEMYWDVRTFGAVMSTGMNAGQVRGPVQIGFARSIDSIVPLEVSITRVAFTQQQKADEKENSTEMGRKHIVPYALYRTNGFISPSLARQTKFTRLDLEHLWEALWHMFEFDRSAARGLMSTQALYIFEHSSELGNAPAHKLFEAITVRRKDGSTGPARAFSDYTVHVDRNAIPSAVRLVEYSSGT